jgi:hypothetical protein
LSGQYHEFVLKRPDDDKSQVELQSAKRDKDGPRHKLRVPLNAFLSRVLADDDDIEVVVLVRESEFKRLGGKL